MAQRFSGLIMFALLALLAGCSTPQGATPAEKITAIQDMKIDTLAAFYQAEPGLKRRVDEAAGYGVFDNTGVNVVFVAAGQGYGVITDNETGTETFMRMGQGGVGLGLGVKDFRGLFVFHTRDAMSYFINKGWEFGGEAEATAKTGEKGGEAEAAGTVMTGMDTYQLTESGLALQATVRGTKYWMDKELNAAAKEPDVEGEQD